MIVYSSTKSGFVDDVSQNTIHLQLLDAVRERGLAAGSPSEVESWRNSLQFMRNVVDSPDLPDDAGVAIEYGIPMTSKRIDFILTGRNNENANQAIVVELKQWGKIEKTSKDAIVSTFLGQRDREVSHPSYQAWTYAALLEDYNDAFAQHSIAINPCVFLHNLDSEDQIKDEFYKDHLIRAPVFIASDTAKLRSFLSQFVRHGDSGEILYSIENGKIRPSKALADTLASLLAGNQEFVLLDDQKLVYETALGLAASQSSQKQVLIVEGGPGTGKSVVAINLLVELTNRGKVAQYVSKNAAPRDVYASKLAGTMRRTRINNLFKGSASYTDVEPHSIDTLIVDEAHRLIEKNRYHRFSENQAKELIRAGKSCVFFLDEDQRVTWNDIGSRTEILKWATELGADVVEMRLESQFRCGGSDGYLSWLDNTLDIRATANLSFERDEFDFQVYDDPNQLRGRIRSLNSASNKARLVAGYCWDWISDSSKKKNDRTAMDITIPDYQFEAQWNLADDRGLWIVAPESVEQIGCIHTCQGLELDHVGVIIGPDLIVRDGRVITDATKRSKMDSSIRGFKKMQKEDPLAAEAKADRIIKNTYRTLLTRGLKSCGVFCVDAETNEYFRSRLAVY